MSDSTGRKLVLFTAPAWCAACRALALSGVIGKTRSQYPDLPLEVVDLSDKEDKGPNERADAAGVKGVPVLILFDDKGNELHRTSSRFGSPAQILKFYAED